MSYPNLRRHLSIAALAAVAAVCTAAPAQADTDPTPDTCDVRLDRLESQFYAWPTGAATRRRRTGGMPAGARTTGAAS